MLNKFLLTLTTVGVLTLSAAGNTYKVSILDNSIVDGKQVKAGDYKLELKDSTTAILSHGKTSIEVPVKTETSPTKYASTEFQYSADNHLQEIRLGGTNMKLVFDNPTSAASGM